MFKAIKFTLTIASLAAAASVPAYADAMFIQNGATSVPARPTVGTPTLKQEAQPPPQVASLTRKYSTSVPARPTVGTPTLKQEAQPLP